MGSMFRSETMALCQLFIQPEAAYASVCELGELGIAQFRDLNDNLHTFNRKFVNEVRLCDELERKLRFFQTEIQKDDVTIPAIEEDPRAPNPRELVDLEAKFEQTEKELLELSENGVNLKQNFLELTELQHVLNKAEGFFRSMDAAGAADLQSNSLTQEDGEAQVPISSERGSLGFVAGVVPRERVPAFERMLWRISHGNVFLRQAEVEKPFEEPKTGDTVYKTVFVAFFQGEQLRSRVKKVCTGFRASLYACPTSPEERSDMLAGVRTRLQDLTVVLNQTQDHRQRVLVGVAREMNNWIVMVRKMKAIYHTLNSFNMDVTKKCLIAECWIPETDVPKLRKALKEGGEISGSSVESFLNVIESSETPPTFVRTNKFTAGFQNLIDSYGAITYQELNPGLYTLITFPFLFAIMFGDAGHGIIMFLFGLYMVVFEKKHMKQKSKNEIWNIFFAGRYIVLLMGLFSIYTGIIYNDFFSKSVNIFGSNWRVPYNESTIRSNAELQLNPKTEYGDYIYPLGMDPAWQLAEGNKIMFMNSFKMKLSIIIGIIHMGFGVCLSVVNHIHFKKPVYILLEFVPQILFLLLLFGYLVSLTIVKWIMYSAKNELLTSEHCAPNVLITFINMLLFKESEKVCNSEGLDCCDPYMFEKQRLVQAVLVIVAVLCIPWLLLAKPIYLICNRKKNEQQVLTSENGDVNRNGDVQQRDEESGTGPAATESHGDHDSDGVTDIFIYQSIHTIEYVLGTISHTASYLRLWALSLAHSQLSEVLWSQVFHRALTLSSDYVGVALIYIIFYAWSALTIAILVLMEGLSAFLHTLRLHWVEFMSKFYSGTGYLFAPFSFKTILNEEENEV